jgi:hypothetical protein
MRGLLVLCFVSLVGSSLLAAAERRPARLWWGGYRHMDQLAEADPNAWSFTRQHADAFLLHDAYWIRVPEANAFAPKLAATLQQGGAKTVMEIGWPHHVETEFRNMGQRYGIQCAEHVKRMRAHGFDIKEVSCDWRIFIFPMVARQHPDWSAEDVVAQITGDREGYPTDGPAYAAYWVDFLREFHARLPDVKIHITCTPVQFSWQQYPAYGPRLIQNPLTDAEGQPILVNGEPARFIWNGYDIWSRAFKVSRGYPVAGFITDSPYSYNWTWPDLAARESHREKIRTYERWLHEQGLSHTFIVNHAVGKLEEVGGDRDAWDREYKEKTLEGLWRYQAEGGRADTYLLESWYDGPFAIVPEDKDGSFTNTVREALLYLKGPGQDLEFSPKRVGLAEYEITLTNRGSVACLPAVRLQAGVVERLAWEDQDVTGPATSAEGWVPSSLLPPGKSLRLTVRLKSRAARLEAWWNPQDPSGQPRAVVTVGDAPER